MSLLLLSLLLQAAPPTSVTALIACGLSAVSFVTVLLLAVRKEVREDGMTPAQRLKKVESAWRDAETRMTGFQQQHERTVERFDIRFVTLEKDTAKVEKLSIDMATMQEQLKRLPDMERKLDHLTALLTEFLAKKNNP